MNEASVIRPEDLQSGVLGKPAAVRPPTHSRQMPAVPLAYAVTVLIAWLSFLRPFEWVTAIYAFPVGNILGICSLAALVAYFGSGRRVRFSMEMKFFLVLCGQFCLAVLFAITVPFCLFFLFSSRSLVRKLFWGGSAAAMLYVVIGTVSRGGLIALLVGVVVCLWNYGFAQRRRTALVVLGFVAFGLLGAAS